MPENVLIHANSGDKVGLGHLVRCITLTKELLSRNVRAELRLKDDEDAVAFARENGITPTVSREETLLRDLSTSSADMVVVDSYAFTSDDFRELAKQTVLVVVDELGDREIPADLVINNNIYADDIAYPAAASVICGPKYCMLREPFRELEKPVHRHPPETVLVTVGGADIAGVFLSILTVVAEVTDSATVEAIVGPYFSPPDGSPEDVQFHRDPPNIHELMWDADLAVSGGGQTLYELAACGTPPVALTLGEDQVRNIEGFEEAGFCRSTGEPSQEEFNDVLYRNLRTLSEDAKIRREMSERGLSIVDGKGVVRVADSIEKLL